MTLCNLSTTFWLSLNKRDFAIKKALRILSVHDCGFLIQTAL